jgi:hypothetical protein
LYFATVVAVVHQHLQPAYSLIFCGSRGMFASGFATTLWPDWEFGTSTLGAAPTETGLAVNDGEKIRTHVSVFSEAGSAFRQLPDSCNRFPR